EFALGVDIGEEREGTAGQRAIVALTMARTLAFDRKTALVELGDHLAAFPVPWAVRAPQIGSPLQQAPLRAIDDRNCMFGGAADWLAAVEGGAMLGTIESRNWRLEHLVDTGEILGRGALGFHRKRVSLTWGPYCAICVEQCFLRMGRSLAVAESWTMIPI